MSFIKRLLDRYMRWRIECKWAADFKKYEKEYEQRRIGNG